MNTDIVFDPIFPFGVVMTIGALLVAATIAVYWRAGSRVSRGKWPLAVRPCSDMASISMVKSASGMGAIDMRAA